MDKDHSREKTLYCSFCTKSQHEVKKLIAGPKVFICDECIDLCNDIIREETTKEKTPSGKKDDLTPEEIVAYLNDYVIGQDHAKKILALALYNHYLRLNYKERKSRDAGDVELEKSNILMIGPTGSGKTLLARTLATLLKVPFATADATNYTSAGYVGNDVEEMLHKLLVAADGDAKKAERGIIYIDEIDKIRRADGAVVGKDVNGEGVQHALLKIIEGTKASVPVKGGHKVAQAEMVEIDTSNILFIMGGAFSDLPGVIARRAKGQKPMGFGAKFEEAKAFLATIEPQDLISFGMTPEFVGRVPIIAALDELTEEALSRVLSEPKNALVRQFAKMLELQGVMLEMTPEAIRLVAKRAKEKGTGARGLHTIMADALLEFSYQLPSMQKRSPKVKKAIVTEQTIQSGVPPTLEYEM